MHDDRRPGLDLSVAAEFAPTHDVLEGNAALGLVLVCDHASNELPLSYGALGLDGGEFQRHIAYDIGAAGVTRRLSDALGAPAVLTRYSRLLIDCNRGMDDPTLIMRLSDGAVVPGNRNLDTTERERRIRLYYDPYHRAIDAVIDRCLELDTPPVLFSVHSFTDMWKGRARPWHAGVLWDCDDRVARPLIEELRCESDLVIGDNEPYSGRLKGDTMWRHGTMRGIPHAIIEIRQDQIADDRGETEWAGRLERILRRMLACPILEPELKCIRHFGSHAE